MMDTLRKWIIGFAFSLAVLLVILMIIEIYQSENSGAIVLGFITVGILTTIGRYTIGERFGH